MKCTGCHYPDSHVVHTYKNDMRNAIERRRECLRCGMRFTTHEKLREPKIPKKVDNYAQREAK